MTTRDENRKQWRLRHCRCTHSLFTPGTSGTRCVHASTWMETAWARERTCRCSLWWWEASTMPCCPGPSNRRYWLVIDYSTNWLLSGSDAQIASDIIWIFNSMCKFSTCHLPKRPARTYHCIPTAPRSLSLYSVSLLCVVLYEMIWVNLRSWPIRLACLKISIPPAHMHSASFLMGHSGENGNNMLIHHINNVLFQLAPTHSLSIRTVFSMTTLDPWISCSAQRLTAPQHHCC